MSDKTVLTVQDCLAGAFQALLRGDLAERDKLCAMAERAFDSNEAIAGDKPIPMGKAGAH